MIRCQVGVSHGRGDDRMAEEFLDGRPVDPGHHQLGSVGMAEHVDGDVLIDPNLPGHEQ